MAKAGYDPNAAVMVWEKMAALEEELHESENENDDNTKEIQKIEASAMTAVRKSAVTGEDVEFNAREFIDSLVISWFGSTHPPSLERMEYMRENMEEAVLLYNEAIKLNGPPKEFIFSESVAKEHEMEVSRLSKRAILEALHRWISSVYSWAGTNDSGLVAA